MGIKLDEVIPEIDLVEGEAEDSFIPAGRRDHQNNESLKMIL
ncbi:MAG: hypothetical protein WEA77_13390 [Hyphomonas sp.]